MPSTSVLLKALLAFGSLAAPALACDEHNSTSSSSFATITTSLLNSTSTSFSTFSTSLANTTSSASSSSTLYANSTSSLSSTISSTAFANSTSSLSSTASSTLFANSTSSLSSTASSTLFANSTSTRSSTASSTIFANSTSTLFANSTSSRASSTVFANSTTSSFSTITTRPANSTNATLSTGFRNSTATSSTFPTVSAASNTTNTTIKAGPATIQSTVLVLARDSASAYSVTSGLDGYGIPYQLLLVPQSGVALPTLNSTNKDGNFGGIIILSEVSYGYSDGWYSALTTAQMQQIYDYQTAFGVRLVRLDVYPTSDFGVTTAVAGAGCCDDGVEQLLSFTDVSAFSTAGLKTGQGVSTQGLYHYPATITNATLAKQIASFAAGGQFTSATTAGVINDFGNRQQLVWFISFATEWSATSNYIMHAHINWMTRGLYLGRKRIYFGTQVDDMLLTTDLYQPAGSTFRLRTTDLDAHVTWQTALNKRLPSGSSYILEIGHNGNGNIEGALNVDWFADKQNCFPQDAVWYDAPADPPLEFQKPLGTGTDLWPPEFTTYNWSLACTKLDTLGNWFQTASKRDNFAHVSHTFTHENLNNATYHDTDREMKFNIAWFKQVGFNSAKYFSKNGLIPPAITGLHNGDAIKAFLDNSITNVVGDNSRPLLLNTEHEHWPLISTVAGNGYAGLNIVPRWSNAIYFNCDFANCTLAEWINTSGGYGDFNSLLDFSRSTHTRQLFGLHHDPFMFHQANLRQGDTDQFTVGTVSGKLSLIQIWVETVVQEMYRLTSWPIISLKHDDIATQFTNRMTLDKCQPTLSYQISNDGKTITNATIGTANGNACSVPVPATFPVDVTTSNTKEKLGSDPLTVWTPLSGSKVTYTFSTAIKI